MFSTPHFFCPKINAVKRLMAPDTSTTDKPLFFAFCALVAWLPLPFGSNVAWAWSIMEIWVFLLSASWCWLYLRHKVELSESLRACRVVLILFCLWLAFITIQIIPLPTQLINLVSPLAAEHWNSYEYSTLSVDLKATRISWMLSLAYALIFFSHLF